MCDTSDRRLMGSVRYFVASGRLLWLIFDGFVGMWSCALGAFLDSDVYGLNLGFCVIRSHSALSRFL